VLTSLFATLPEERAYKWRKTFKLGETIDRVERWLISPLFTDPAPDTPLPSYLTHPDLVGDSV
jgi:hypothetical protein